MTLQELQKQVLELSAIDRWVLSKLLVESLQPTIVSGANKPKVVEPAVESNGHSISQYYGCIDDETFIRHPQPEQLDREPIL